MIIYLIVLFCILVGLPGGDKQLIRSRSMAATNWVVVSKPLDIVLHSFCDDRKVVVVVVVVGA